MASNSPKGQWVNLPDADIVKLTVWQLAGYEQFLRRHIAASWDKAYIVLDHFGPTHDNLLRNKGKREAIEWFQIYELANMLIFP